ncbi:cysteine proteinase [Lentinula guzmanii]|uniref:Cysteine proteinase n=1 Tax=Lentinula guzmanii TaxID=2804957 RepID=A0AA38JKQ4_9AGAR|nr:cysteine proteinase [Lentinula guzmanii]
MVRRTGQASSSSKGLAAGQVLRRDVLNAWGWVGTEVTDSSSITRDHLLATCGLSRRNNYPFCRNNHKSKSRTIQSPVPVIHQVTNDDIPDDVIVISDGEDEGHNCGKKVCKGNPNCLNYLGQEKWESEESVIDNFLPLAKLGENPVLHSRDPDLPVGLKNLGATCYANASLQVLFRQLPLLAGVYGCHIPESKIMDSPIFQLQVTFAALQEGIRSVFNPSNLVESLQLRTAEQQDAQEFSKLFMTHLDAEFKKQPNQSLQTLVNSQFEGEQVYGTMCDNCKYRSERCSNFWEIEVNFQNNSRLEECIGALLEPETLTGDNKYFCVQCNGLQDATRYTKLRRLPPVLHISLLRFVYDLKTMERKKSTSAIVFPKVLNLTPFISNGSNATSSSNVYELRGILMHKGSSAYHGHYEAQVFDAGFNAWFLFNDEEVTRMKEHLGDKRPTKKVDKLNGDDKDEEKPTGAKRKKNANGSRKRQRVEDSEDEALEVTQCGLPHCYYAYATSSDISSKDAYQLIYALRQPDPSLHSKITPPPRAMNVVNELNASHDRECDQYTKREKSARLVLKGRRMHVSDIYNSWSVASDDEDCVVVSRKALQNWLSGHSVEGLFSSDNTYSSSSPPIQIPVDDIICTHGLLDHRSADMMKRISRAAYTKIVKHTNCVFQPALSLDDICSICVKDAFKERMYQMEHHRLVAQFNEKVNFGNERSGYWISKAWLRDWVLQKPKMHVASEDDPPPDSPEYVDDVRCEHGKLSLKTTARRRISIEARQHSQACHILTSLFPEWKPNPVNDEPCPICEVTASERKANNSEHRKQAETEKAKLKHMLEYASDKNLFLENVDCALIPLDFLRCWRKWANKPSEFTRPDDLDNSGFLCEHGMLNLDFSDFETTAAIIKRNEWDVLEALYKARPLIALSPSEDNESRLRLDLSVCSECRQKRFAISEMAEITVRLHGKHTSHESGEPSHTQKTYGKNSARQSKRLRQTREHGGKKRIPITKLMSVKDLKIALHEKFEIPTICQRLMLHGQELLDNEATIESLHVLANDTFDLYEESETLEISDTYDDVISKNEEGQGFGGTLLGVLD